MISQYNPVPSSLVAPSHDSEAIVISLFSTASKIEKSEINDISSSDFNSDPF
jgi:hypothetical protein